VTGGWNEVVERLYREHGARLWRSLVGFTGDREVASDAEGEAFAQLLRRGEAVRDPARWVWRAAFRIAAGEMKERRRVSGEWREEVGSEPAETAGLIAALGRLSPKQRAAIVLHHYAGYPVRDVASILASTPPASGSISARDEGASDPCSRRRTRSKRSIAVVDLDERLRRLDGIDQPDLWVEVQARAFHPDRRDVRAVPPSISWKRVGVAALALSVAAATVAFAVLTFRRGGPGPAPRESGRETGSIVLVGGPDGRALYRMRPDGSGLVRTGTLPPGAGQVRWSPDGSLIAFERGVSEGRGRLEVASADGTDVRVLDHPKGVQNDPSWSPAGDRIAFFSGNGDLFVIGTDGRGLVRVADGHSANCAYQWPEFSPDGNRIVAVLDCEGGGTETQSLVDVEIEGGVSRTIYGPVSAPREIGPVDPSAETLSSPAWSTDGSRVAFAIRGFDGVGRIWTVNVDGSDRRPVTSGPTDDHPAWSPDGRILLFERVVEGHQQLFRIRPDGGKERRLTTGTTFGTSGAWVTGAVASGPVP
jgi:DNA-directed RNA polymerase specialized sigma24 family protein